LQNKWTEQDNNVTTNFTYQTGQFSNKSAVVTETSADKYQECQESSETDLHTYNIYAKEIDGYYFAGWERPNGDKIPTSTSEEDGEDVISNLDLNFEYTTTQDQRMQPTQINIEEHKGSIFGSSYTYTTYELEFPYTLEAVAKWVLPQVTTVNNSTSNYLKSIPIEDPAESKKKKHSHLSHQMVTRKIILQY
jgi:hypothetical protein